MRRIWHLALAAVLGAILGSASMATYLYFYQVKVESNTQQIEKQDQRLKRLEQRSTPKPTTKKPVTAPKRPWWQVWRD